MAFRNPLPPSSHETGRTVAGGPDLITTAHKAVLTSGVSGHFKMGYVFSHQTTCSLARLFGESHYLVEPHHLCYAPLRPVRRVDRADTYLKLENRYAIAGSPGTTPSPAPTLPTHFDPPNLNLTARV